MQEVDAFIITTFRRGTRNGSHHLRSLHCTSLLRLALHRPALHTLAHEPLHPLALRPPLAYRQHPPPTPHLHAPARSSLPSTVPKSISFKLAKPVRYKQEFVVASNVASLFTVAMPVGLGTLMARSTGGPPLLRSPLDSRPAAKNTRWRLPRPQAWMPLCHCLCASQMLANAKCWRSPCPARARLTLA